MPPVTQVSKRTEIDPVQLEEFMQSADPDLIDWLPDLEKALPKEIEDNMVVRNAIREMNDRIYLLMQIEAAISCLSHYPEYDNSPEIISELIKLYIAKHATDKNNPIQSSNAIDRLNVQDLRLLDKYELELLKLLREIFGESGEIDQKTGGKRKSESKVEHGNLDHYGALGLSPLFYRNIFEHKQADREAGQYKLRELMYIVYRYVSSLKVLIHFNNQEFIDTANLVLGNLGQDWQIDLNFIKNFCGSDKLSKDSFGVFERGPGSLFTRNIKLRVPRVNEQGAQKSTIVDTTPSSREKLLFPSWFYSKENKLYWQGVGAKKLFKLNSGRSKDHFYSKLLDFISDKSKAADDQFFLSGPSGMTDSVFTILRCVGLGSPEYLSKIRLGLMATMLEAGDHNSIEIGCSSSLTFGIPFSLKSRADMLDSIFMGTGIDQQLRSRTQSHREPE